MESTARQHSCVVEVCQILKDGRADNTRDIIAHLRRKGYVDAEIVNTILELEQKKVIQAQFTPAHMRQIIERTERMATGKRRPHHRLL